MLLRRRRTADTTATGEPDVIVEHGPSLAKGPAMIVGTLLVAFGLASLLKNSTFPNFSSSFPDGTAQGSSFLGFEVNGWTAWFCIAGGGLLLFGCAQHHLAKAMSLIVGLAAAACAIIAIIDGDDVLGLAAANGWTKLGWAVTAAVLFLTALLPRRRRERPVGARDRDADGIDDRDEAPTAVRHRRGRFGRPVRDKDAEPATTATRRDGDFSS